MIREAIAKVKDAVASKDIVPWMTHYCINDGYIHATNGNIIAAAPFPDDRTYLVPARPFEKTLDKMPSDDIKIELTPDGLKISCGRYRAKLSTFTQDIIRQRPEGQEVLLPQGFMEKLQAIRAFMSDNATQPFALCVLLDGEHMVATNNVSVTAAFDVGLPEMYSMLPVHAVDFILGRDTFPVSMMYDERSMSFKWNDGSWVRTGLYEMKFPTQALRIIEDAPQPEWEITKDWRDVYSDVSSLVTSTLQNEQAQVRFYADRIVGGHGQGDFSVEIATPIPINQDHSRWNPKFLTPVIESATMFAPELWPQAPFTGPLVAGVIMGMR